MEKLTKAEKRKSLEEQSNITLISTSVAIVSLFVLLYAQNIVSTNYLKSQTFLLITDIVYALAAVGVAVLAVIKKEKWLWEYAIFGAIMTVGYYFLLNPGVSGLPFLYSEAEGSLKISSFVLKLSQLLNSKYILYGLWFAIIVYCIVAITIHTVKYNKIKKQQGSEINTKIIALTIDKKDDC